MKKLLFILLFPVFGQAQTSIPDSLKKSLDSVIKSTYPIYDTCEAVVKYDGNKTDTCTLYFSAKKAYIFEDLNRFGCGLRRKDMQLLFGEYVAIIDWRLQRIVRKRNKEGFDKKRMISFEKLK